MKISELSPVLAKKHNRHDVFRRSKSSKTEEPKKREGREKKEQEKFNYMT